MFIAIINHKAPPKGWRRGMLLSSHSREAMDARVAIWHPPIRFGFALRDAYKLLGLHHLDEIVGAR